MDAIGGRISVLLADDNLLVREGVRSLLSLEPDLEVVGVASDYDELVAGADAAAPQVVVTDIRMPPSFQEEGIEAAREVRKRHPGTGVVVLSQYQEPEYAIDLLRDGAAGYAYLLKDRVNDGDRLAADRCSTRRSSRHSFRRCGPRASSRSPRRTCCARWPRAVR
jgi:DNA-binding NarL/FixJ family response regulator